MNKPILCLDFDGVIHSYTSGWRGAARIPDPAVPGALEFIVRAQDDFTVAIHSSRSHQWGGRAAMKQWLRAQYRILDRTPKGGGLVDLPKWWSERIMRDPGMEPWSELERETINEIIRAILWPIFKPPAVYTIDDRGHQFDGTWPTLESIAAFRPWNKKTPNRTHA